MMLVKEILKYQEKYFQINTLLLVRSHKFGLCHIHKNCEVNNDLKHYHFFSQILHIAAKPTKICHSLRTRCTFETIPFNGTK